MIDHLSMQCAVLPASAAFYDAVLAPLGYSRVMDFDDAIAYGLPPSPDFWIGQQRTGAGHHTFHGEYRSLGDFKRRASTDA